MVAASSRLIQSPFFLFSEYSAVHMPTHYRQIAVADIDLLNTQYALNPFSSPEPDSTLKSDIQTYGILHPPLLLEQADNTYIVLSGKKQVQAAAAHTTPTVTALIIRQTENSDKQFIFSTLIRHRRIGSELSCIEQAVFFQKTLDALPAEETLQFLPLLGLKEKPHIPAELISLLSLVPEAQRSLHEGTLSLRAGKNLLRFPAEDQVLLTSLINELQLGGSKQQKLLDQVFELTKRRKMSSAELLADWQEKEKDKQHNGPQKAAALLKWLQRQCSPKSTEAEDNFGQFSRQMNLQPGVRLDHALSFEDEQVTLSIDFPSRKQLTEQWPQIRSLLQDSQES